jgi:phage pi2 protein 07
MVDMMKQYNYLYDVIHDRLNKMMARNWGKMARLDLAKKPNKWKMEKWLYYAKTMGLFIEDSFNEGLVGQATGKLAGGMNSNTQGVIDADFGNNI